MKLGTVSIKNCYNSQIITGAGGNGNRAGGIVGVATTTNVSFMNCYNNGTVVNGKAIGRRKFNRLLLFRTNI
ncbi:MAG: hypothetical protein ACI4VP_05400 [Clostridia bacterium]